MGRQPVDIATLRALRHRPNSDTDVLAVRLRRTVEDIDDQLDTLTQLGLARRGTFTQLWNTTQLGRQLIERLDADGPVERAFDRMMRHNAGVAGLRS